MYCTAADAKPSFPSLWVWPALAVDQTRCTPNISSPSSSSTIDQEQENLGLVMDQARAITDTLDGYVRRRQRSSLPRIRQTDALIPAIHWRNAIQHKLLSLHRADGFLSRNCAVYEACRLATLIYSNMVIFPYPACSGVPSRLAIQMRKALDCCSTYLCWEEEPLTMLWLTVMGGITATDRIDKQWYARKLRLLCSEILQGRVPTWQACTEVLETYLWWQYICDEPGRELWVNAFCQGGNELENMGVTSSVVVGQAQQSMS
jgi:hypothetical protein